MTYDLLIIGGGINGTAIARDAALNGLKVLLAERDDLASHTSSASSKLIHGGLRYLEYGQFRLVREALQERELLLRMVPHLIRPMRFVLPHSHSPRPWWMVRLGLYIYDWLGGRISLPRSRGLRKTDLAYTAPLEHVGRGFVYADAWVDDARLVVLNAVDAAHNGAEICTQTVVKAAHRVRDLWEVELGDGRTVSARALVNAAGPWVAEFLSRCGVTAKAGVRLVKGSHIIVDQLFAGDQAYLLQQPDRRVVFAIPYHHGFTLIGTTDVPVDRPDDPKLSRKESDYLREAANRSFRRKISPADIKASYSGIRALYDDGASEARAVTRDYVLELDANGPPLLSVFGGKITTARHLAETAMAKIAPLLGVVASRPTRVRPLPGGNLPVPFDAFVERVKSQWPFLGALRAERMARAYGTRLAEMLNDITSEADLGEDFGAGLSQREVDWLITHEWAQSADDILNRRTKIGLVTGPETRNRITTYLKGRTA